MWLDPFCRNLELATQADHEDDLPENLSEITDLWNSPARTHVSTNMKFIYISQQYSEEELDRLDFAPGRELMSHSQDYMSLYLLPRPFTGDYFYVIKCVIPTGHIWPRASSEARGRSLLESSHSGVRQHC